MSYRLTRSASALAENSEGESTNNLLENSETVVFSPEEMQDMIQKAVKAATVQFELAYNEKLRYMKAEMLELRDTVHKL